MSRITNRNQQIELMLSFGIPARISHADGYISLDENGQATFYYYLQDHLGNVRSVITPGQNNLPEVVQANDYYPFGMSYSTAPNANKLLYNSKEEQEMPGRWLDYGFRFYDSHLARFHAVDPLTEDYAFQSPYAYAANNPLRFIDPDGRWGRDQIYYQYEGDNTQSPGGLAIPTTATQNPPQPNAGLQHRKPLLIRQVSPFLPPAYPAACQALFVRK